MNRSRSPSKPRTSLTFWLMLWAMLGCVQAGGISISADAGTRLSAADLPGESPALPDESEAPAEDERAPAEEEEQNSRTEGVMRSEVRRSQGYPLTGRMVAGRAPARTRGVALASPAIFSSEHAGRFGLGTPLRI